IYSLKSLKSPPNKFHIRMMNEKTLDIKDISHIPILDGTNYGHWQMRMKIYLQSRELLDVCKKYFINDTSTSSSNQWSKASFEAINVITSRITERVFREIINSETIENSHLLWSKTSEQYASKRAVNQGRVWMDWKRCFFDGNLQNYIHNCRKIIMELYSEFSSHNSHSGYLQNKKGTSSSALITEYDKPHKIIFYCSQGKHNRRCTTHKKEECRAENPHFRPTRQEEKWKNNPKAHLSIVQALATIRGSINPMRNWVIVDCGANHHMLNSPKFFPNSFEEIKSEVATGDSQSNLLAHGIVRHPLDSIHIDVVGPITPESVSGSCFLLPIVDQATSYKIIRSLERKSKSFDQFFIAKNYMENHHDRKIKKLVSNRGGELLSQKFENLSNECGSVHIFSPPETLEHNGYAKRANRTVMEKARCLINHSNLPNQYWAEAVNTSVFLSNLSPTPSRENKSPHLLWRTNTSVKLTKLQTFGSVVTRNATFEERIFPTVAGGTKSPLWDIEDEQTNKDSNLLMGPINSENNQYYDFLEDTTNEDSSDSFSALNSPFPNNSPSNHEEPSDQQQSGDNHSIP
ncbi:hypothetical protein O181_014158, partial [Austropuccinia psidii MF-1]|nr:hypothetical protein [Austropuccinia psidii MF-1]